MKKSLLLILAAIVIVAGAATAILCINKTKVDERAKIEDAIVCYFNVDQLAKKGAFGNYLTPEQRKLYASMATANIENKEVASHIDAIINDFNCSGIDFTKPIYGYFDEVDKAMVFVAEVVDANTVDTTIDNISYLIEQKGEESLDVVRDGDSRTCILDSGIALAYNNSRATLIISEEENLTMNINEALSRKLADLSPFGDSDMAIYFDAYKFTNFGKQYIDEEIALYSNEGTEYLISDLNTQKLLLDEWSKYITPDARLIADLTFEPGRVKMSYNGTGFNTAEYDAMMKRSSGSHLNYISKDALMILNIGMEGKKVAENITAFLNSSMMELLDFDLGTEANMAISILCDAIESISGDTTLAVESIDGQMKERINYYTGRVMHQPLLKSVDAAVMMDVTDNYIITNVGQFTMGLLRKVDQNKYFAQFGNYAITLEQNEGLLFGGVNMKPEKSTTPATEAKWAKDVADSYFYWVVDVDNMLANKFINSCNNIIIEELDYEYREMYNRLTQSLSYIYYVSHEPMHNETVLVFDDNTTNSLQQITDIIMPVVISEINKDIF